MTRWCGSKESENKLTTEGKEQPMTKTSAFLELAEPALTYNAMAYFNGHRQQHMCIQ